MAEKSKYMRRKKSRLCARYWPYVPLSMSSGIVPYKAAMSLLVEKQIIALQYLTLDNKASLSSLYDHFNALDIAQNSHNEIATAIDRTWGIINKKIFINP